MPSPVIHISAGYLIFRIASNQFQNRLNHWLGNPTKLVIIIGASVLPDIDAIVGILLGNLSRFHNNASHSLFIGFITSLLFICMLYIKNKSTIKSWFIVVLLAYEAHILLDLFTGERGVQLLWPFTQARFTSPIKLFLGVQWGLGPFSIWHLWTIFSEVLLILVIYICMKIVMYLQKNNRTHIL